MLGNEGNANQELVSEPALQRAPRYPAHQLNVLTKQGRRAVQRSIAG